MFIKIVQFEIRYRLKRPATYIYFFLFLALTFLITGLPESTITGASDKLYRNAPEIISQLIIAFMIYGSLVIAAIMGVPVHRDYEHNIDEIMFSLPVKRYTYLWGRFSGSFIITVLVFMGIILGLLLGNVMPWHDAEEIGPFRMASYLHPLLIYVIPNIFITGVIFFVIGTAFRSHVAIYAQGVLFLVIYFMLNILMRDVDFNPVYAMFEPFGSIAVGYITKYWTTFERNTMLIPFEGILIWNRIAWMSLAALVGVVYTVKFKPYRFGGIFNRKKAEKKVATNNQQSILVSQTIIINESLETRLVQWWHLAVFNFKRIILSIPFLVLMGCGIGLMALARFGMSMYGTPSLPVTYMLLDSLVGGFMIFLVVVVIVYTGELVWKDINNRFAPIIDSSPVSDRLITVSKFTAMILVELTMLFIIVLSGIGVQIINGFFDFQPGIYFKGLLLDTFPFLFFITLLTFFVHSLVNNKFLGHGLVIAFFALSMVSSRLGLRHILFKYGTSLTESYSGMNGYQKFVFQAITVDFYWLMLGIVFFTLSIFLIKRGSDIQFSSRWKNVVIAARKRQNALVLSTAVLLFIASGGFIYYNTNVLNEYRSKKEDRAFKAEYENTYSKFADTPQPRVTDVKLDMEIYPGTYACNINGRYELVNKNDVSLDSIHVRTITDAKVHHVKFNRDAQLVHKAEKYGYYIYVLEEPLQSWDTLSFDFEIGYQEQGFSNWGRKTSIIPNGTYFINQVLPYFGYDEQLVLKDKKDRKKAGLPEKKFETAELTDTAAYGDTYISPNADRISYEATLGTVEGQTAITCGKLQRHWTENGRAYFHYKMELPMWNLIPFLSAKYEVVKENHQGTELSIYYHKSHDYNLDKMMKAMKMTLDYCGEHFSEFQHDALKIVEFPRYRKFAQSFSGVIPFSEAVGFITDVDVRKNVDVPFYVTSHEVAHQWWGHQVAAADVKGKLMLIESMANYTALMVMEKEFGKNRISDFLKYEQDLYLMGRAIEKKKEVPLYLVDNQAYVAYRKGSVMFYQLKDFIGEENLNRALSQFIEQYSFREAPYPTSIDFMGYIEKEVPDSMQYLMTDLFKTITLFSNRIDSTRCKAISDANFSVSVFARIQKFTSDSLGRQKEMKPNDWLELGLYTRSKTGTDSLVYTEMVHVSDSVMSHKMMVDFQPTRVALDPFYKVIDRNLLDNEKAVKFK